VILGGLPGYGDLGPENDERLRRLRASLELGSGFQLIIVEAEPGPIRREVVRRIASWAGRGAIGPLEVVSFHPGAALAALLAVDAGAIVTGLEPAADQPAPRDWIGELNWARDALPRSVPGPLILVVSQALHQALFERAPDLYSWRRHATHIAVAPPRIEVPLVSPDDRFWRAERERLQQTLAEIANRGRQNSLRGPLYRLLLADVLLQLGDPDGACACLRDLPRDLDFALDSSDLRFQCEAASMLVHRELVLAHCALLYRDPVAACRAIDRTIDAAAKRWQVSRSGPEGPCPDEFALPRGRLHLLAGEWDAATAVLESASSNPNMSPSWAAAHEALCQIAFARGDLGLALERVAALGVVLRPQGDTWGPAIALRLGEAVVGVYPDAIEALLDVVPTDGESADDRTRAIAALCLRAERAWQLERPALARAELATAQRWIRDDDPPEIHARLAWCHAGTALAAAATDAADVDAALVRASDLYRARLPAWAATAGLALGLFRAERRQTEPAIAAYRRAAEDARLARDTALTADAELGELVAVTEAKTEQEDTHDRLRALADGLARAGRTQSEGVARTQLGRSLEGRGMHDAAEKEWSRARDCFATAADAAGEARVTELLAGSG
jgi:tetratricopeptide (TPR) repeat protein